ncbi:MAG TPA: poly-beta-1,6-N-acetyl-D-glucosamine biosynthesis protein PgaD [Burkholderiaceae bacterium]|jgi:biofilm PGA synthesis protein PgaD
MKNLIFEKPSLSPLPQRVGWAFFTALFWIIWVYLWMPLITLITWALGLHAYTGFFESNEFFQMHQMGHLAILYTAVVCVMGSSLLLWARIEFLRFHNVNRRSIPVPVKVEELAKYASLPEETLRGWTNARRVVVHHDNHGHVIVQNDEQPGI